MYDDSETRYRKSYAFTMPFLWCFSHAIFIMKHPPPSGLHAMRSLYVIGRDGWVWDMSITCWLDLDSSHEVGEYSVTAVCQLAGGISDRPLNEVIVIVIVKQTMYSIYNIIVSRGYLSQSLSSR